MKLKLDGAHVEQMLCIMYEVSTKHVWTKSYLSYIILWALLTMCLLIFISSFLMSYASCAPLSEVTSHFLSDWYTGHLEHHQISGNVWAAQQADKLDKPQWHIMIKD